MTDATYRSLGCKRAVNTRYRAHTDCLWTNIGERALQKPRESLCCDHLQVDLTLQSDAPALRGRTMTMPVTLAIIAVLAALALFCGWRGARPPDLIKGPRLVPYRLIMVSAAAGVLVFTVHLVNLLGITTGRP